MLLRVLRCAKPSTSWLKSGSDTVVLLLAVISFQKGFWQVLGIWRKITTVFGRIVCFSPLKIWPFDSDKCIQQKTNIYEALLSNGPHTHEKDQMRWNLFNIVQNIGLNLFASSTGIISPATGCCWISFKNVNNRNSLCLGHIFYPRRLYLRLCKDSMSVQPGQLHLLMSNEPVLSSTDFSFANILSNNAAWANLPADRFQLQVLLLGKLSLFFVSRISSDLHLRYSILSYSFF